MHSALRCSVRREHVAILLTVAVCNRCYGELLRGRNVIIIMMCGNNNDMSVYDVQYCAALLLRASVGVGILDERLWALGQEICM